MYMLQFWLTSCIAYSIEEDKANIWAFKKSENSPIYFTKSVEMWLCFVVPSENKGSCNTFILNPYVHMLDDNNACIAFTRLTQYVDRCAGRCQQLETFMYPPNRCHRSTALFRQWPTPSHSVGEEKQVASSAPENRLRLHIRDCWLYRRYVVIYSFEYDLLAAYMAASVCLSVSVRTKSRKLLTRNWCNLVGICRMVSARSDWRLVTFDLDL